MAKSVYSIVLDDQIVEAVDAFAGRCGLSRSAAINHILAQHVQMDTPRQQMQQVFAALEEMAKGTALQLLSASQAQMQLRSPLQYKYNPTLRYQIELYPEDAHLIGVLRVSMRTQNQRLVACLEEFYHLWAMMEKETVYQPHQVRFQIENGRFARLLRRLPQECCAQQTGEILAAYTDLFDRCLKAFFQNPDKVGAKQAEQLYQQGLQQPMLFL